VPNGRWQILRKSRSTGRPPWQGLRRVIGRRTVQSPGRKQVGRLVLSGIAAHAENIAALGNVRQSRIWRIGAERRLLSSASNASANLMPTRRRMPQNTILISRQASPSSTPRSHFPVPARFVRRSPQGDYRDCSTALCGFFSFPSNKFWLKPLVVSTRRLLDA
jgi:hypothetical protein